MKATQRAGTQKGLTEAEQAGRDALHAFATRLHDETRWLESHLRLIAEGYRPESGIEATCLSATLDETLAHTCPVG